MRTLPRPSKADHLLREAFPLLTHLAHHLRGANAIDEAERLIGDIAEHLQSVGLMKSNKEKS